MLGDTFCFLGGGGGGGGGTKRVKGTEQKVQKSKRAKLTQCIITINVTYDTYRTMAKFDEGLYGIAGFSLFVIIPKRECKCLQS